MLEIVAGPTNATKGYVNGSGVRHSATEVPRDIGVVFNEDAGFPFHSKLIFNSSAQGHYSVADRFKRRLVDLGESSRTGTALLVEESSGERGQLLLLGQSSLPMEALARIILLLRGEKLSNRSLSARSA